MKTGVRYRKQLSTDQVSVLSLVYKFRFISTELLAKYLGKDRSTIYERLYVLVEQGYLLKQYDGKYKLAGRPATYCLATKGIRTLLQQKEQHYSRAGLRNMYRNKALTPEYIEHCVAVMAAWIAISLQYPEKFIIYTRNELAGYEFLPNPKPDILLRSKDTSTTPNYILDIFDNASDFLARRRRLKVYVEHEDSGDWIDSNMGNYPNFLFIVPNDRVQNRFMKEVNYYYERSYIDEDEVATKVTTLDKLLTNEESKVWQTYKSNPYEEETKLESL